MEQKFEIAGFKYTDDQEIGLDKMIDWSHSASHFFTLSGAAGTGKTTVLERFIKENKYTTGIAITAPTHKAVRIVSQTTGLKGETIQKLLGLRPNLNLDDFDINNPKFDPNGRKAISDYQLIIVDEASMINDDLYALLTQDALTYDIKVLFVGDKYQLPPVRAKGISRVFTHVKERHNLETIVRQANGNPLLELLEISRNDVKHNTFNLIKHLYKNPARFNDNKRGYIAADKENFKRYMVNIFASDEFTKDINHAKFCAYTNDNVLAWNSFVRSSMYKNEASKIIILDDLITAYSTILDEFLSQVIVNSEDYIIDDIQDYVNQSGIKGYIIRFRKVFGGNYTPHMFVVDTSDVKNINKFLAIANSLIREAKLAPAGRKGKAWENFYKFKDNNLLLKSIFDERGKLIVKKDLDYGYCLTVHKTQGSTYKHVFVNLKNIMYNKYNKPYADKALMNKLIYVSLSRATDTASILL